MNLFDDKKLVLDILNTEAGRYILGEKDSFPIFKFTDNSYHQIIEDDGETMICRAKMFPMKYVRYHFEPIFTKMQIANEYERIRNRDSAFLHFANLKRDSYLPQIFLSSVSINGYATGTGFVWCYGTWAAARGGTGTQRTNSNDTTLQVFGQNTDSYYVGRAFMPIDTSSISDYSRIASGTIYLYTTAELHTLSYSLCTVLSTQASLSSLVFADFAQTGTSEGSDRTTGNFTVNAYKSVPLNSTGLTWISRTGYTQFAFREARDIDNSTPASAQASSLTFSSGAAASNKPYLELYYAAKSYLKNIRRTRIPGSISGI